MMCFFLCICLCLTVHVCVIQSAAAAPSPVLGNLPPGEGMPVGPVPPGFFQVCMHTHMAQEGLHTNKTCKTFITVL